MYYNIIMYCIFSNKIIKKKCKPTKLTYTKKIIIKKPILSLQHVIL